MDALATPHRVESTRQSRRAAGWFGRGLTIVVLILLASAMALAIAVRPGPGGVTTLLGHPVFTVQSGSMTPTFDTGDLIVDTPVSRTAAARMHPGQVISFMLPGTIPTLIITHRIVAVLRRVSGGAAVYRTKGDANNVADAFTVPSGAIVGVYQGVRIPWGGYLLTGMRQPLTLAALALLGIVLLAWGAVGWVRFGAGTGRAPKVGSPS